ncbi:hypothetical protein CQW23_08374 [Capsicum baccatum]|uniref:Uncharacterized protein n=1 Tax=Capsicum baccatum TaxID=33114 RepID=A0A2G2X8Q9_CAPBA|nr:hypothetical protein CQW23_08374 [Capsicum baccatum]
MMEQVIDPKCISSVAINFSVVTNAELLLDKTRLRKVEQKSTIIGLSVGSPVAALKMNMSEVVKQLKERRYPTYEPQSKVIGGDFDLLSISTDGDINGFELSYVIPNMKNSHDADLIIKSDEEIYLNKVGDDDEMVIQENLSSIETFGEYCALKTLIIDVNTVAFNKGNFPINLNVGSDVHGIERNIATKGEIEYLHNLSDKMLTCKLQGSFENLTHVSDILMETKKSWNDNTYLVEKVKNQIMDIWMESLMVDHKLSSPWSLDQPGAMNCTSIVCGYSHIRNALKISVERHIGLLILHFRGKSYTIRNALVGELEKLVMKAFNDMEVPALDTQPPPLPHLHSFPAVISVAAAEGVGSTVSTVGSQLPPPPQLYSLPTAIPIVATEGASSRVPPVGTQLLPPPLHSPPIVVPVVVAAGGVGSRRLLGLRFDWDATSLDKWHKFGPQASVSMYLVSFLRPCDDEVLSVQSIIAKQACSASHSWGSAIKRLRVRASHSFQGART